jgi:hypothetical protein
MSGTGFLIPNFLADVFSLLPVHVWAALGAIAALLIAWLRVRHEQQRYVAPVAPPNFEDVSFEVRRIANALERLAAAQSGTQPGSDRPGLSSIAPSMFGR